MKDYTTNEFPSVCPICGGKMVWDNDSLLSECGFVPDDADEDIDGTVTIFHCSDCDTFFEFENTGDEYRLLCSTPIDDDKKPQYTKYGNNRYTARLR